MKQKADMNRSIAMLTGIVVMSIAGMSIMFVRAMMTWSPKVFRLSELPFSWLLTQILIAAEGFH